MQLLKSLHLPVLVASLFVSDAPGLHAQLLTLETRSIASADLARGDEFGRSVDIDGDWAVVGARSDQDISQVFDFGSAYMFYRHEGGDNQWGQVRKLTTIQAAVGNRFFGAAVAISGDTVAVGAYQPDRVLPGAVYIFERHQGGPNRWGQVARIEPADGVGGDQFGFSLDLHGDTLVVGANLANANDTISASGAVYVHERNAGGPNQWGKVRRLVAEQPFGNDLFGQSVAVFDDVIAVGVPGDDILITTNILFNAGSVCLFGRDVGGLGQWGFMKSLNPPAFLADDGIGNAVALHGETLVVGSHLADATNENSGAVYVFERHQGGANQWGFVRALAVQPDELDRFGASVDVHEDTIVAGASFGDGVRADTGVVYRFRRDEGGEGQWGLVKRLGASQGQGFDRFGESVAVHGDVVIAGAWAYDVPGNAAGAAYVYWFPSIPPTLSIQVSGTEAVVSWDPPSEGYVLQRSPTMGTNTWVTLPSGDQNPVSLPRDDMHGFFRLILP